MKKAPKSLRLHIGVFGRTNVGKSSFLNMVAGQDVSITSEVAGTTTDVVEKTMELLPLGPVVFLDTAGLDDKSVLAEKRIKKTEKIFNRADVICLITESGEWGPFEDKVAQTSAEENIPLICVINKEDIHAPSPEFVESLKTKSSAVMSVSSVDLKNRDNYINNLKQHLITFCPADFLNPPPLVGDLLPTSGLVCFIVPIDLEAPKGRIILPQVQAIRDTLDADACCMVVKEKEYAHILDRIKTFPDLVVCDSQVVSKMVADTPKEVICTTFSILFSRFKGDLAESVRGVLAVDRLKENDKILVAEACSHHAIEDDIGRVKLPKWLKQYTGKNLKIDTYAGKDYPENLAEYKLVIHCGGCMTNRREMLSRINLAKKHGVPITNYGICISYIQGVLRRTLSPFPEALDIFDRNSKMGVKKERIA